MDPVRILVIDDDPDVRELLDEYLSGQGFLVTTAAAAAEARQALERVRPALVLLDVGLPGEDGLSLARHIRERHEIGIVMVSGAGETVDRIVGLEVGADDYLAKPFDLRELRARLKSVLRRYAREPGPVAAAGRRVPLGPLSLDLDGRRLLDADGVEVPLTRMEFDLLQALVERPNRPLSRDQLLNRTQNRDWDPFDRSIDIRIARLRSKVEAEPARPRFIRTVRGIGYMFVPDPLGDPL